MFDVSCIVNTADSGQRKTVRSRCVAVEVVNLGQIFIFLKLQFKGAVLDFFVPFSCLGETVLSFGTL